jgi:hypothetical protein
MKIPGGKFINRRHNVPGLKLIKPIRPGLLQDVENQLTSNTDNNKTKDKHKESSWSPRCPSNESEAPGGVEGSARRRSVVNRVAVHACTRRSKPSPERSLP